MKYLSLFFILGALLLGPNSNAQDVAFSLANPQITNGGTKYELDIMISSSTGFKLGSGQLYFNYNELAFGENAAANSMVEFTQPSSSILALTLGSPPFQFSFYSNYITNDNTTNRVSFAWQHAFSEACIAANNVSSTPALLAHVTFTFLPGANAIDPQVCFESQDLFANQTFTACGPSTCTTADCQNNPGTQLSNDTYDCSALLPVELRQFEVQQQGKDAVLSWTTSLELGSSHFDIEKSVDGQTWHTIGSLDAAGYSETEQKYGYTDANFQSISPLSEHFYYRLLMVDLDGSFEYSPIGIITGETDGPALQVYPNPVKSSGSYQIIVSGIASSGMISGTLFDSRGRKVYDLTFAQHTNGIASINLNANALEAGVYFIKIDANSLEAPPVERLIIQ